MIANETTLHKIPKITQKLTTKGNNRLSTMSKVHTVL